MSLGKLITACVHLVAATCCRHHVRGASGHDRCDEDASDHDGKIYVCDACGCACAAPLGVLPPARACTRRLFLLILKILTDRPLSGPLAGVLQLHS